MLTRVRVALACATMTLGSTVANAATYTYDITASDFSYFFGPTGDTPFDPVTLDFSVTFDPTGSTGPTNAGLDITSFTLPYTTGGFAYYAPFEVLSLGTDPMLNSFGNPNESWGAFIYSPFSSSPTAFLEQTDSNGESWDAYTSTVTTGVPETSTWAMLLIGFSGLALAVYRASRKRVILAR